MNEVEFTQLITLLQREMGQIRDAVKNISYASAVTTAPDDASYVVISNTANLSAERALAVGATLTLTDGGAGSSVTLALTTHTHQSAGAQGGQLDHGAALTGLTDDDHTQYLLRSLLTTLGDTPYGGAAGAWTRLAGNITTTRKFLEQTGDGALSAAPAWDTVTKSDVGLGSADNTADSAKNVLSATKWTTARNLAGNSTDGSANVAFANKFIVQGTADSGLSAAQFLGALGTGVLLNTTTTGVLSLITNAAGWLHNDNAGTFAYTTPSKSDVGLGSVENTALSTWAGTTNLTTLGTIATGVWSGTAILAAKGGTGQTVYAVGDILAADTTTTLSKVADVAVGSYLRSGGANTLPLWSTLILPNAATSTRVPYATGTNTWGESANLTFNGTTLTANTIGAFTLSGTVAGGGNQINNIIIGTSTPLAGSFTTLNASNIAALTTIAESWIGPSSTTGIYFKGGSIGIGTATPAGTVNIAGSLYANNFSLYDIPSTSSIGGFFMFKDVAGGADKTPLAFSQSGYGFYFSVNGTGTKHIIIDTAGKMGLAMTPGHLLDLNTDDAGKPTTNTWTIVSDARLKTVQRPFTSGLTIIKQLNPVVYRYNGKGGFEDDGEHVNILAQDLLAVAPEMLGQAKGHLKDTKTEKARMAAEKKAGNDPVETVKDVDLYTYQGHNLQWMVVNALKELDTRITKLGG